jgi:hypothetical protein
MLAGSTRLHTVMRDWSDSFLDDVIAGSIRQQVAVPPQQRQRAWEQLREKAAAQTILPPAAQPVPYHVVALRRLTSAGRRALYLTNWLIMDDTVYERALKYRTACQALGFVDGALRNMTFGMAA